VGSARTFWNFSREFSSFRRQATAAGERRRYRTRFCPSTQASRHVATGTLAVLAQRVGKVWASPSTWYHLVRQYGWRRPRLRVHPAKPKVGLSNDPSQRDVAHRDHRHPPARLLERGHHVLDRPDLGWVQSMGRRVRTGRLIVKRRRGLPPSPGMEPTRGQSQEPQERPQRNKLTGTLDGSQHPDFGASVGQALVCQHESRGSK
jgi:hypothetical protein